MFGGVKMGFHLILMKFIKDETGLSVVEYVVGAGLLVAVLTATFTSLSTTLPTKLSEIISSISVG